ncbi:MAG TPA: alternative ribosome rescue aminoacyl-tRNA hydrolase ArfB [Gemmatimonadales bacterium]|jgi:ribosome-associated protein|nr:alternative ribosome rescue aminoacyl-tRNA hydrolase ArfB [Gemmatimonadales bacterium]
MPAPIPLHELTFRATRAGGPGGQHVNTSSTRVELWWHAAESPSLTETERTRLLHVLGHRLDGEGWLRLVSAATRSQLQNREAVIERLQHLVAGALVPPKRRRKTKPPRAAAERRLQEKKRRSATKAKRRQPPGDD